MGLDLWFPQDIARILAATHEAMRISTAAIIPLDADLARIYRQGFVDALRAVAVAFGVGLPPAVSCPGEAHPALTPTANPEASGRIRPWLPGPG